MEYYLEAESGVRIPADAKTLAGAKREASKWISFGSGDVYVISNGAPVCKRKFWEQRGRFGWKKRETV
jgi:hypothetical protein